MLTFPIVIRLVTVTTTLIALIVPMLASLEPGDDPPTTQQPELDERRRLTGPELQASGPAVESSASGIPTPTRPTITRTPPAAEPGRDPDRLLGEFDAESDLDLIPTSRDSGHTAAGGLAAVPGASAADDPPGADADLNRTSKGAPDCKPQCNMTGRVKTVETELIDSLYLWHVVT